MSWNHVKAATSFFYSEKLFVKNRSRQQQIAFSSYQLTEALVQTFTITCLWSECSAQLLSKLNIFPYFAWIHVQVQWNPCFSSWSFKACFFRGPEIEFLWNCGIFFKETVSFDDIEQSKDEENIVTYVDYVCGFNFYSEAPTEVDHINPERKIISRSCGKPNFFPTNDPKHQLFYRRRAHHYNLSEPIHYMAQRSSSSYDTQQHYW